MEPLTILIILLVANVPVYWFWWKTVFKDMDGFIECLRYWITPDTWSWLKGEGIDDFWAEFKLFWFVLLCIATVAVEYGVIHKFFL